MTNLINILKRFINAVVPVLFVAAGIGLVLMGVSNNRIQKNYLPAAAVVSSVEYVEDSGRSSHYETIARFTADGSEYEAKLSSANAEYSVGQEVALRYDPADPTVAVVDPAQSSTMYFVSGAIAVILGLVALLRVLGVF